MLKIISKLLLLLFFLISLNKFGNCQTGWYQQISNTNNNLYSVMFLDANTGYSCGNNNNILKTTNGGVNWVVELTYPFSSIFYSLFFINVNTGYIAGTMSGHILKTTNGGLSWDVLNSNTFVTLYSIYFVPQSYGNIGYAAGDNGTMVRTTNAGLNWYLLTTGTNSTLLSIYFTDINTGYAVGSYYTSIKTTNAGADWFGLQIPHPIGSEALFSVAFPNNLTGYVSSWWISKTTNSGLNWSSQLSAGGFSLSFPDINTGYVVGSTGKIYKTINGGNNWFIQTSNTTKTLMSVYFVNQNTGWAVGDSGVILKTTNGGGPIGIKPIGNIIPDKFVLYQNYPNPFNSETRIRFDLPTPLNPHFRNGGTGLSVKLILYDMLGREVTTFVNEQLKPGIYEVEWDASNYPSGMYFYRLITDSFTESKKMLLIK